MRRSDGATEGRSSSAIGVGLARAGWHDLGERESELGVARGGEESRQLRERESRN